MEIHFGNSGNPAEQHLFETWLRGRGDRNRIAITTKTGGDPENVDLFDRSCFGSGVEGCHHSNVDEVSSMND